MKKKQTHRRPSKVAIEKAAEEISAAIHGELSRTTRQRALELAIDVHRAGGTSNDIIKNAQAYFDFITGVETAAPSPGADGARLSSL